MHVLDNIGKNQITVMTSLWYHQKQTPEYAYTKTLRLTIGVLYNASERIWLIAYVAQLGERWTNKQ